MTKKQGEALVRQLEFFQRLTINLKAMGVAPDNIIPWFNSNMNQIEYGINIDKSYVPTIQGYLETSIGLQVGDITIKQCGLSHINVWQRGG